MKHRWPTSLHSQTEAVFHAVRSIRETKADSAMGSLLRDFERHLKENLDITVTTKKWDGVDSLPFFLRDSYTFYEVSLLNCPATGLP